MYLNIAACNIKTKDYDTALAACNEALKLDPYNLKGLYRRARSLSLPINASVEDFRTALVDLKRILEITGDSGANVSGDSAMATASGKEIKRL